MGRQVILISKENEETEKIRHLLSENKYATLRIENVSQIEKTISTIPCNCIIFDLDSIEIDNRAIRELTIRYPSIYFLCMSKDRFHPELKDAICYHIYACLTKPFDNDELIYWLRCIDIELESGPAETNEES